MALNIKDPETDRLVRELVRLTGEPITVATRLAVQERLDRLRRSQRSGDPDELDRILERGRRRAVLDSRPEDDLLGYGPTGLPE